MGYVTRAPSQKKKNVCFFSFRQSNADRSLSVLWRRMDHLNNTLTASRTVNASSLLSLNTSARADRFLPQLHYSQFQALTSLMSHSYEMYTRTLAMLSPNLVFGLGHIKSFQVGFFRREGEENTHLDVHRDAFRAASGSAHFTHRNKKRTRVFAH